MGNSVHFDLTKLKYPVYSREENVDIASSHLVAVEGHGNVTGHSDDCTSEGGGWEKR